ncbi:S-layer homology domain-containing protein [Paenibacillus sp. 1_12]|uniref:S-layer homology domain-containing protein n=1 Tax=Paenibacillus sp. 1_12 TaxID=1566278 RepID=UPI0008E8BF65|nr:S-layer homology domain-containing protein [Paenibacillus sp. 1_12]SFM15763.1 S-layer homology domain-containing protein [Paenibacillus sp. 1_12]
MVQPAAVIQAAREAGKPLVLQDEGTEWIIPAVALAGEEAVVLSIESVKTFGDMANHWSQRTVEVMAAWQIANGVSEDEFAPDDTITRAQLAALLSRILQLEGAQASFSDVEPGVWYEEEVGAAAAAGIIQGDGDSFRPDDAVTRQEMAMMIFRAYEAAGGAGVAAGSSLPFTDASEISGWAEEAVAAVYSLGIAEGNPDGTFAPGNNAARGEALTMLLRFMDITGM